MNIAFFLTPKNQVAYLYDDCTLRQSLEKMRYHGYTAIPVIDRKGCYVGALSEGDLLWQLVSRDEEGQTRLIEDIRSTETICLHDVLRRDRTPPARITASVEELLHKSLDQNFIPVIDDSGVFIGIVTRRNIIRYFWERNLSVNPE